MFNINDVRVSGTLVKEPIPYSTSEGDQIYRLVMKVYSSKKTREGNYKTVVDQIIVVAKGSLVNFVKSNLTQGSKILITGSLRKEEWINKETNQPRSKLAVYAHHIQLDTSHYLKDGDDDAAGVSSSSDEDDE